MVFVYIDYILVKIENDLKCHLNTLEKILYRLAEAELKSNAKKSSFVKIETEYLVLLVIDSGVRPLLSKV